MHVDGVQQIDEFKKLLVKTKYDVIIVGLFMNTDHHSFSSAWLEEASKVNKDCLIIIMNYPAGGIVNKSGSGLIEHISNQKLSCKAIRMAVPLRRVKLLRTIGEVLNKKLPSPTTNNVRSNNVKLITDEERSLFSTMHILIAEGNIRAVVGEEGRAMINHNYVVYRQSCCTEIAIETAYPTWVPSRVRKQRSGSCECLE